MTLPVGRSSFPAIHHPSLSSCILLVHFTLILVLIPSHPTPSPLSSSSLHHDGLPLLPEPSRCCPSRSSRRRPFRRIPHGLSSASIPFLFARPCARVNGRISAQGRRDRLELLLSKRRRSGRGWNQEGGVCQLASPVSLPAFSFFFSFVRYFCLVLVVRIRTVKMRVTRSDTNHLD